MKNRTRIAFFFCIFSIALGLGTAEGGIITWNFDTPAGVVAGPHTYLDETNTFEITASGFTTADFPHGRGAFVPGAAFTLTGLDKVSLFGKLTPGDPGETGLGLAGFPNQEIQVKTWIQLDFGGLDVLELKIPFSGIQSGEGIVIFGSDTAAAEGVTGRLEFGDTRFFPEIPGFRIFAAFHPDFRYEWITATVGDVLIGNGLEATLTVPEPEYLLLLISGFTALIAVRRRLPE